MGQPALCQRNQLLACLPGAEWKRWSGLLEPVDLPQGKVLHESGSGVRYVYFPLDAIVALHHILKNGALTEVALVGNEGVVGISGFMGGDSTTTNAVVVSPGKGLRMRAQTLKDEFEHSSPVLHLMLRYTQALITQMTQTAVCNRHHSIDQSVSRWLLFCLDRVAGSELTMTQGLIASMLGVRREGVTGAALKLQRDGLIRYTRGHVTVLDRKGLEHRACECYGVVKKEYDRLLPWRAPT